MKGLIDWFQTTILGKGHRFNSEKTEDIDEYFIKLNTLFNTFASVDEDIIKMFERDRHSIVYLPIGYVKAARNYIINLYTQSDDPIQRGQMSEGNLDYTMKYVADIYNEIDSREEAIFKKSGFLMYNIISKHPFTDGNKRSGITICNSFLEFNGYTLGTLPFRESYEFITEVAMGKRVEIDCEEFIKKHARPLVVPDGVKEAIKKIQESFNSQDDKGL